MVGSGVGGGAVGVLRPGSQSCLRDVTTRSAGECRVKGAGGRIGCQFVSEDFEGLPAVDELLNVESRVSEDAAHT